MAAAPFAFWCRETHSIKFLKNSLQFLIKFVLINNDELQFDLNLQEMFIWGHDIALSMPCPIDTF